MDNLSNPRFTSLEKGTKGRHSAWTTYVSQDLLSLKTGKGRHSVNTIYANQYLLPLKTRLKDITLYILFK